MLRFRDYIKIENIFNPNIMPDLFIDSILKNIEHGEVIGIGENGIAFKIPNSKVLKITIDKSEADIATFLINKDTKHIVKYYNVSKIINPCVHI